MERNLTAAGYEIFEPEKHPLAVQIDAYRKAEAVVFSEGSALHLFAFVKRPEQRVAVIQRRQGLYPLIPSNLTAFDATPVSVIDAVKTVWWREQRTSAAGIGELDFDAVRTGLVDGGLIGPDARWATPDADALKQSLSDGVPKGGRILNAEEHAAYRRGLRRKGAMAAAAASTAGQAGPKPAATPPGAARTPARAAVPDRPVTLVVMARDQVGEIDRAIDGAFAQTYPDTRILLSDDCSDDGTFARMRERANAYEGPHRISLNRNDERLGETGHLARAIDLAETELIILNFGADSSEPDRARRVQAEFAKADALMVDSAIRLTASPISGVDRIWAPGAATAGLGLNQAAKKAALCHGASCAVSKNLFRLFGPVAESEADIAQICAFRALLAGRLRHIEEPLLRRRASAPTEPSSQMPTAAQLAVLRQRLADIASFAPENGKTQMVVRRRLRALREQATE